MLSMGPSQSPGSIEIHTSDLTILTRHHSPRGENSNIKADELSY